MKRHFNLIPLTLRKRQLQIQQLRRWAVACGAAAVLGGVLLNSQYTQLAGIRQTMQQLEDRGKTLRSVAEQSAAARRETHLLSEQAQWLRSLEQSDAPLLALAAINQSTSELLGKVQLDRLQLQGDLAQSQEVPARPGKQPVQKDTPVPQPTGAHHRIELNGSAVNDSAIGSLLGRIEATGLFSEVELVGLQAHGNDGRTFQLRCVLQRDFGELSAVAADLSRDQTVTTVALPNLNTGP